MKSVLHILAQRIIVGTEGEITAYGLNSLFVHLRCFTQDLSNPGNGKGGSEHVPLGAQESSRRWLFFVYTDAPIEGMIFESH